MEIALAVSLAILVLVLYFWRTDRWSWERERERLLDRWQAPTLESFKAAQREVKAAKQRAIKHDQPGTPVDYEDVPDDLETAPVGQGLIDDVISGRARSTSG